MPLIRTWFSGWACHRRPPLKAVLTAVPRLLPALALALTLTLAAAPAPAAGPDAALAQARDLLAAGKAQAAFDLLAPLEAEHAGEPGFDYLLGIAAIDSGRPTRGIFALERLLAREPDNALARAEIARAYLAVGELDTAKGEFQSVRRADIPAAAAAEIDRYLDAIGRQQAGGGASLRGYLETSLAFDSNVNSATGVSQVAVPSLGGLVVTLDPSGVKRRDTVLTLAGGFSVSAPLAPDLTLLAGANLSRGLNESEFQFQTGNLDGHLGLSLTRGAETFTVAAQGAQFDLAGQPYRQAFGLIGQWQHRVDAASQFSAFIQGADLHYPDQFIRDARRSVVGLGYSRAFGRSGPVAYLSGYAGKEAEEESGVPHLGHDLAGLRLGGQWSANERLTLFGDLSYEERAYGGPEPFFTVTRRDQQVNATLGARYTPAAGWRITPQVALIRNESNVVIYDFRRTVYSVSLRREFQ